MCNSVEVAIKLEKTSIVFCSDAAESTSGLMADVPQALEWIARAMVRETVC